MGARNPARYLAPLALAAAIAAAYLIVHAGLIAKTSTTSSTPVTVRPPVSHRRSVKARFYVVRPGDNLSAIAARTGVPLGTLQSLNPGVNPAALQTGQRLTLRRQR